MGKVRDKKVKMSGYGKMTDAQKSLQMAREVWEIHKGSATSRAKRWANEEHYQKTLGGRSAVRITLPALKSSHLDNAIYHLKHLVASLEDVQKQVTDTRSKMFYMRSLVYTCHRNLKHDADRGYSHPNYPEEDFRGAR